MNYEYSKALNEKWETMIEYINDHGVINGNLTLLCENIETTCILRDTRDKFPECLNSAVIIIREIERLGRNVHIIPPSSVFTDEHGKTIVMDEISEGIIPVNMQENTDVYFTTCFISDDGKSFTYVIGY